MSYGGYGGHQQQQPYGGGYGGAPPAGYGPPAGAPPGYGGGVAHGMSQIDYRIVGSCDQGTYATPYHQAMDMGLDQGALRLLQRLEDLLRALTPNYGTGLLR
jgi:hypothetical protein